MADERFSALAAYLEKAASTQAGEFSGKQIVLHFVGEPAHVGHVCILLGYDTIGINVKKIVGPGSGSPETQFYLWHTIASINP